VVVIGERLKALREHKKMSQGDIEKRTGSCESIFFGSREWPHRSGHRDTQKAYSDAESSDVQLFYDGEKTPKPNAPMPLASKGAVPFAMPRRFRTFAGR
jgi:transcriptional regulator with XRE-family HTH domain